MATYLITGANRGIGLEYCRQISARGDQAIAICRESSSELEELGIQIETGVDITSEESVQTLAKKLQDIPGSDAQVMVITEERDYSV
ncbi:SDR family NAD(P)-dependent oxidoreductase [[Leptolyngbya] sp. PCC 7376]|uniref:SDR family NAD(P)-dependent oxidoreductase n=1 Tax=[Leptolyngbya] sp. PCC 7376 TaxID=111781 RepID=UPI0003188B59|nr:SDR family NAD(P)-dependent oxidoreductase [[Leptolyngbya] sp. PCC 7376]